MSAVREDLAPAWEDYSISLVVAPGTCADHTLHAMCERLSDEARDGGCGEGLPDGGRAMASDLLAEADDWLDDHHRCDRCCATCPQCHPVEGK